MSPLETTEVVLVYSNIPNNDYQKDSKVLHTFAPDKWFSQLLDTLPKVLVFLKNFNLEFSYIDVWFTDQNSKPLEIENKTNITIVIN